VAEFCDQYLDTSGLAESVEGWSPFGRKGLCEYLGIGESTLSGWFKEGRIPRMAKNAFVLLLAQQRLSEEIRGLRTELDDARAQDLRVVGTGQHFQVCEFQEDEEGEIVGRVVADNIATLDDARLLASGHRALRLAREAADVFQYVYEQSTNDEFICQVKEIERHLEAHELFVTDHEGWRKRFGKKSSKLAITLEDLDKVVTQRAEQPPDQSIYDTPEGSDD
jgi:hypothetical protein